MFPGYSAITDAELLQLLKQDTEADAAFTELYNRYWKRLLAQALHRLGDETEAEEVVQDVFMNLWKKRLTLEIKFTFHTYIASSVKYEILSRLARKKSKIEFEKKAAGLYDAGADPISRQLDYESTRQQIEETVKELPEKCQLVFRLSREEGLSEKEIARQLAIAPKTVEAHLTKALKTIRKSFQLFYCLLCWIL